MRCRRVRPLFLLLALAACVPAPPPMRRAPQPVFDPIAFFAGETRGEGRLSTILRAASRFTVHGRGRIAPDGSLVLDQTIVRAGRPAQQRSWRIRRTAPGGYAASLSSAEGPVAVAVDGNILRLDFREDGLAVHQAIALAPDGRTARNRMSLSKLGLRVAAVEERIARIDPAAR
jgi:hypothetical protein